MKNYDFYIATIEDISLHFAYDGTFEIHGEATLHYKDFERAFAGFRAARKIFDLCEDKRQER